MKVKEALLRLAFKVDPTTKSGKYFDYASILQENGDIYTPLRLLSIYNEARKVLLNALRTQEAWRYVSGFIIEKKCEFERGDGYLYINKPDDYIKIITLLGKRPVVLLPIGLLNKVFDRYSVCFQDKNNIYVFELSDKIVHYGDYINGEYTLVYYGIRDHTLDDVENEENFSEDLIPILIDLAVAVSTTQGLAQVNALAVKLLEMKK